jgi:nucleotide-binding universal stress UspA family protein
VLTHLSETMDLVVVGAHQHGIFQRAIAGSVSTAVVEHAHCPVAVIPVTETD